MSTQYPFVPGYYYQLPPAYRLHDSGSVGLATFLGGPLAGSFLLAANYNRLGKSGSGILAVVAAMVMTGLVVTISLTDPKVAGIISLVFLVAVIQLAKALQGAEVAAHVARGGVLASKWGAVVTGVVTGAVVLGAIYGMTTQQPGAATVKIGTRDEIIYSGTATGDQAMALGNALKNDGYFQDRGVTVLLKMGAGGTAISFVVQDGYWNKPDALASFEEVVREVAPSVGGLPVKLQLVNAREEVEKTSTVGAVQLPGNDVVYYAGSATQAQAQALGQNLQQQGYMKGRGVDVYLTGREDGTRLDFVVADGAWNDAAFVSDFETITRDAAPAIGGLPLEMRLVSTKLVVEKDEKLQ